MDVVLGVSMAPETIRMVLVEGQDGDGVTVEEDSFDTATAPALAMCSASEQVVAAILGTREGAAEAGHHLLSTGVTWTDQAEAGALRDALAAHKVENVMLVSAFLAAAALTQTVGNAIGYEHIAMLFVQPDTATLAVVDSADGSITDVHRQSLPVAVDPVLGLISMVASVAGLESRPEGLFLVGSGVDIAAIKPRLEAATPLAVSAPEDPETALARGAALASANAPLFASSTAALAYAQDPGTGSFPYVDFVGGSAGASAADEGLAYSAADEEEPGDRVGSDGPQRRSPMLLVGSTLATIVVGGVVALAISLAIGIRPTVALRPEPGQNLIVPAQQAPSPPTRAAVPRPESVHQAAPVAAAAAPAPVSPPAAAAAPPLPLPIAAPAPVPIPAPAPVAVPAPAAVPIPVPVPAAPIRIPAPQPPVQLTAPQPPVQLPQPPVRVPGPPVQATQPPLRAPQPPVRAPQPPVRVPNPPVRQPNPPIHVPSPPLQAQQPPVHVPGPPVYDPSPPVRLPTPQAPVNLPSPQPPVHIPAPQPPMNLNPWSPAPPVRLPAPQAPVFPAMPAPAAPRMPAMPAPAIPAPAMPAPAMPHFNMPAPAFRF
jgi:hypothetical protein